jgi:hypothetical protein
METLVTTIVRDERIKNLKEELNRLALEKFIDEVSFEDIRLTSCIHTITGINYMKMYVYIPEYRLNTKDKVINKKQTFHLGKSSKVLPLMINESFRNQMVRKVKESLVKRFLNK